MGVGFADDIALDLHVHHDEVGTIEHIGHNTTHKGSSQDHCIWLFFIKELLDSILVCQVQLLVAAANKVGVTTLQQVVPNGRTNQAIVACYINLTTFIKHIDPP